MRFCHILSFLPIAACLSGRPPCHGSDVKPWEPAGAGDSRGPCPILNTLANHGYLPHNGRNITVEDFGAALHEGIGWSVDIGVIAARGSFARLGSPVTIDLEDLINRESGLDHAASLVRADDSNDIVPARIQALLDDSDDTAYISPASLAVTRRRLEEASPISEMEHGTAVGEAGFVMAVMLDGTVPAAGTEGFDYTSLRAFKSWTKEWLTFERLPVKLGWKRSELEVTFADLGPINAAIEAAIQAGAD